MILDDVDNNTNNNNNNIMNDDNDEVFSNNNHNSWDVQDVRNQLRKAALVLNHYSLKLATKWYVYTNNN